MVEAQPDGASTTGDTGGSVGGARVWVALAAVAVVLHVAIAWFAREPGILTGQDDAEYILLGRSILQGGYNELFRVDAPLHRTYPPAYPAALAVWSLVFGDTYGSFAALNILFSALSLAALFLVIRRLFDPRIASLAVIVLAFNPGLVEFAGGVRSEPLYILCSLIGLYWVLLADHQRQWLVPAVFVILLGTATRSVGVTLLVATGIHWLLDRRWRRVALPAGVAALAVAGWFIWSAAAPDQFVGTSYMAELRSMWVGTDWTGPLPGRAFRYLRGYVTAGAPWMLGMPTIRGTIVDNVAGVLLGGSLILVGLATLARRWRPAFLYLLSYAGLLLIWIFYVSRFVLPLVPLLVLAMLLGASAVGSRFGRRGRGAMPVLVAVLLLLGAVPGTHALLRDRVHCDRAAAFPDPGCMTSEQAAFFDALRWISGNTPPDAVFLTAKSGALYYYTGRRSISFQSSITREPTEFLDWTRDRGAEWILLGRLLNRETDYLAPLLHGACQNLELMMSTPPVAYIFRIADSAVASSDEACNAIATYRDAAAEVDFAPLEGVSAR